MTSKKKPGLIIKFDNKLYSKENYYNTLAKLAAQLYRMKQVNKKVIHTYSEICNNQQQNNNKN